MLPTRVQYDRLPAGENSLERANRLQEEEEASSAFPEEETSIPRKTGPPGYFPVRGRVPGDTARRCHGTGFEASHQGSPQL